MNYVYNILIQLIFFIFFSFSILGYGFLLKDKILKIDFNFGETGILGFFVLYVLSVLINLFVPINIYLSLVILFFGRVQSAKAELIASGFSSSLSFISLTNIGILI